MNSKSIQSIQTMISNQKKKKKKMFSKTNVSENCHTDNNVLPNVRQCVQL